MNFLRKIFHIHKWADPVDVYLGKGSHLLDYVCVKCGKHKSRVININD